MEKAIAYIEQQEFEIISTIKESWLLAFEKALTILPWSDVFLVEYNPNIWRILRHPVGIRMILSPLGKYIIFEFATPNHALPFDCFDAHTAKIGVMVHEIAHLIDDLRWDFDFKSLAVESREYVSREQRAELLAFAGCPLGIFEANKALIRATINRLGYDQAEFQGFLNLLAAVETLGRLGMNRGDDIIELYKYIENKDIPVHMILREYLATNVFSLAGFTTGPDLNMSTEHGIKKSKDLTLARIMLCEYLDGKIDHKSFKEKLEKLHYKVRVDSAIQDYNPLNCIDFDHLNQEKAKKNISEALKVFQDKTPWKCFYDLQKVLVEIDTRLS